MGGSGESESAHVRVNTVSKSGEGQVQAPAFHGDASKVECKGLGIKKSFAGRMSQFNVDATKAGACGALSDGASGAGVCMCRRGHAAHRRHGTQRIPMRGSARETHESRQLSSELQDHGKRPVVYPREIRRQTRARQSVPVDRLTAHSRSAKCV